MIDERIYMASRIFRLFCERYNLDATNANSLFNIYNIWAYIDKTYEVLHLNGDESALSDVEAVMIAGGAVL